MYKVTALFKDQKVTQLFYDLYDAIDFKDTVDAHYPDKVTLTKGVFSMREWIYNSWNVVMDYEKNPLSNIPDFSTRHLIMQVLAWMWCITFAMMVGSWTVFGISAIAHVVLIGAIVVTVATFRVAQTNPNSFSIKSYDLPPGAGNETAAQIDRDRGSGRHRCRICLFSQCLWYESHLS